MCNNNCNNNCTNCTEQVHICNQCEETTCTGCPITDLSTDCVLYTGDDIECGSTTVIPKNTILSDALSLMTNYNCIKFAELANYLRIVNTGVGASIYSGDNLIGEKKLRKLKSTNGTVTITQGTDDINFSIPTYDGSITKIEAGENVNITGTGTAEDPYIVESEYVNTTYTAGTAMSLAGTTFNNTAPDQIVSLTQGGATTITGTYPNFTISSINTVADGSETKVNAGTNISVTGAGTTGSPYVINSTYVAPTPDGSETKVTAGSGISVSGSGTIAAPYIITNSNNGSETKIIAGTNITITGDGTIASPYVVNTIDLTSITNLLPVNRGYFSGLNVGTTTGALTVYGDVTSATATSTVDDSFITVNIANSMGGTNYYVRIFIESSGTLDLDNDNYAPVFKINSPTQFSIGIREVDGNAQNLKVHIETIKY